MYNEKLQNILKTTDNTLDYSLERLFDLLRIPSISADPSYDSACWQAAHWLANTVQDLGFVSRVEKTTGKPIVVAHRHATGKPRLLFYGHYDVQPPDPLELWENPPFEPFMKTVNGQKQIVARGASDDKGQLMTFVEACRAWITNQDELPLDVTLLFEGEEEVGSPSIPSFLRQHAQELTADFAFICDTSLWKPEIPSIITSLRGSLLEEIILQTADRDLHSGLYGGIVPNPIVILARILADIVDHTGRIQIPEFYDNATQQNYPLENLKNLEFNHHQFLQTLGLSPTHNETPEQFLNKLWYQPTYDVNGIYGGYSGKGSKTVIPCQAGAKVSFRLIDGQDPHKIRTALRHFVEQRVPLHCSVQFISHAASYAVVVDQEKIPVHKVTQALKDEFHNETALVGNGATIPIASAFKSILNMNSLLVGFALDDDRIHSPNEKYELSSFHHGIRSWCRILHALSQETS